MYKTIRAFHISYYIFCITIIIALVNPSYSLDTSSIESDKKITIRNIYFEGNKRTREKTILLYMNIDTGDVCDSSRIAIAEENLRDSDLFDYVKIFPIFNKGIASLHVLVREKRYFSISDYSGAIYDKRYGSNTDRIWLQGYGTVTFNNFRGRDERLNIYASLIRIRYIGVSWYKPFITIPYYFQIGSTIGTYPSIVKPWHIDFFNTSYLTIGRHIGKNSSLYSSLIGKYKKCSWEGAWYSTDSVDADSNNNPIFDTTYYDSIIEPYEEPFSELFLSLGWKTDKRKPKYNPHNGFYFSSYALTNALYPFEDWLLNEDDFIYLELANDFRFFHRGIWESNTVAYRIRPLIRLFGRGNIYSGIYMGNEITLRGYGHGAFGGSRYNNRLLFSWEYRFPIVELPELQFPWLAWYDEGLKSFRVRIDGAFILDCGYIWEDLVDLRHPKEDHQSAAGAGFGFRFMFPFLKRSICAEIVFPFAFPEGYFDDPEKFGEDNNLYSPALYLYLDIPF